MQKSIARTFEKSYLNYIVAAMCAVAAVSTVVGNLDSLAYASFSQILLYVALPVIAYIGFGTMIVLRTSALLTVIPATLGCLIAVMLESYLTVLFTNPDSFPLIWVYLNPANIVCLILASVLMTVGCVLYILCAMGVLHTELFTMITLGISSVALLAEYLLTILEADMSASPWYMISTVLFLMSMVLAVVCFEPVRPASLGYSAAAPHGKKGVKNVKASAGDAEKEPDAPAEEASDGNTEESSDEDSAEAPDEDSAE